MSVVSNGPLLILMLVLLNGFKSTWSLESRYEKNYEQFLTPTPDLFINDTESEGKSNTEKSNGAFEGTSPFSTYSKEIIPDQKINQNTSRLDDSFSRDMGEHISPLNDTVSVTTMSTKILNQIIPSTAESIEKPLTEDPSSSNNIQTEVSDSESDRDKYSTIPAHKSNPLVTKKTESFDNKESQEAGNTQLSDQANKSNNNRNDEGKTYVYIPREEIGQMLPFTNSSMATRKAIRRRFRVRKRDPGAHGKVIHVPRSQIAPFKYRYSISRDTGKEIQGSTDSVTKQITDRLQNVPRPPETKEIGPATAPLSLLSKGTFQVTKPFPLEDPNWATTQAAAIFQESIGSPKVSANNSHETFSVNSATVLPPHEELNIDSQESVDNENEENPSISKDKLETMKEVLNRGNFVGSSREQLEKEFLGDRIAWDLLLSQNEAKYNPPDINDIPYKYNIPISYYIYNQHSHNHEHPQAYANASPPYGDPPLTFSFSFKLP